MPETHKLQRKAAAPEAGPADARPGHNNPPTLKEELEAGARPLIEAQVGLELAKGALPAEAQSDDHVALITAWVVASRKLASETEKYRVEAKAPILVMQRTIDSFFNSIRDSAKTEAAQVEQRSVAYLHLKRERERKRLQEEEAERRRLAQAERDRAEAARQAADDARLAKEAADEALRKATTAEQEEQAMADYRQANARQSIEEDHAQQADDDARKAEKMADRSGKAAAGERLDRTAAGGGAAKLTTVHCYRITDRQAVRDSLGPLAPFLLPASLIEAALQRAADAPVQPAIPGVTFYDDTVVATHATRT